MMPGTVPTHTQMFLLNLLSLGHLTLSLNPYFEMKEIEAYRVKRFAQSHGWGLNQAAPKLVL